MHLRLMIRYVHSRDDANEAIDSVLTDISCNMSCRRSSDEWLPNSPFASGVRKQPLGDARCTIITRYTPAISQG